MGEISRFDKDDAIDAQISSVSRTVCTSGGRKLESSFSRKKDYIELQQIEVGIRDEMRMNTFDRTVPAWNQQAWKYE
ncbi:hypothetical protein SDJN02_17736 [Cucurbita argyrosperma subsp. argyrosperma]|nr:hypothetical protein SDJN02_17736 [Cucurbita argyrosperma subsp. argyrosperma]